MGSPYKRSTKPLGYSPLHIIWMFSLLWFCKLCIFVVCDEINWLIDWLIENGKPKIQGWKMEDRKMRDWKCGTGNCRTGKCRTWNTNINSTSAHKVIDHSTRRLGCDKYQRLHRVNWQSPAHRTLIVVTSCLIRTKNPQRPWLCVRTR